MRSRWAIVAVACLLGTGAAQAGYVELGVNDETADIRGGVHFGSEDAAFFLGGRYLYTDDDDGDAKVPGVILGFSSRPTASDEFAFTAGVQGYFGEVEDEDIEGAALGAMVLWNPGGWRGFFVGGSLFWAPSVLSFGETDKIREWGARGGYAVNEHFSVFLEYVSLEFDTEDADDIEAREDVTFGLNFSW